MSRSIRHAPRAFTSLASGSVCCDICHNAGARYSAKDGKTLCVQHRAELRGTFTTNDEPPADHHVSYKNR